MFACMIPERFWAEAIAYTVYVLNRSPHNSIKNITPEEK